MSVSGPGGLITSDSVVRAQDCRVLTDTVDGASTPTFSYTYDDVGRLTKAVVPGETLDYGFGGTVGCGSGSGVLADPGKNGDRASLTTTPSGGSPSTFHYCFGTGDQLLSSTGPNVKKRWKLGATVPVESRHVINFCST